jgi:hypothetical protein
MQASSPTSWITAAALGFVLVFNVIVQSPGLLASKVAEKLVHPEPHFPLIPPGWTVDRASAAVLQVSACLACFSCVVSAFLVEQWLVVGLAVAGTVTSFFYWREPVFHGLARKLDVIVILSGLNCHFYLLATGAATGSALSVCMACLLYAGAPPLFSRIMCGCVCVCARRGWGAGAGVCVRVTLHRLNSDCACARVRACTGGILAFLKSPAWREAGQPKIATLLHIVRVPRAAIAVYAHPQQQRRRIGHANTLRSSEQARE